MAMATIPAMHRDRKDQGIPLVGIYDLISHLRPADIATIGFNKGGTVDLGGAKVTMVNASHSSTLRTVAGPMPAGPRRAS
jgi:L-ascorbate metabolism protein UlaG (beta-lactamase superfamily)